jgi:uncharacterized repeat protein (TIGR01451 family)
MGQGVRIPLLALVILAGLGCLPGCFGVSQNPSYFPHLLPTEDIIRTHAKPPGPSYFSNFDPHAIRLEVRPLESTGPVRTQHVIIATVYDEKGQPRRDRRVEWMLEGAGNIVEVDESGIWPGRGYKVDNKYAVSYTDYHEHRITRGNADPNDDFVIRPGQTWCVVTSAVEGDTHVTVYAPEIANWDAHKVFVTRHWLDAEWILPAPAVNRAGTEHVLTTNVFRHTDRQPLTNYRVRYRILDGPPAIFLPNRTPEAVVISDLSGNATLGLAQVVPQPGVNRIGIEIIRPPDPLSPSGSGIVIGRGETTKQWQGSQVSLTITGPPTAGVGQEIPYTIAIANIGAVETQGMTVRTVLPDGAQFVRADPRPTIEGNQLVWTLGLLPGNGTHTLQVVLRSTRAGPLTACANVTTIEGLRDEKCTTTQISEGLVPQPAVPPQAAVPPLVPQPVPPTPAGQLNVTISEPPPALVGSPVPLQITVTNSGSAPAINVLLNAAFDLGLEHETRANPLELPLGTLGPGESKTVPLTLVARQVGRFVTRVTATADGNLRGTAERAVTVQTARLAVAKTGPAVRYLDQVAAWDITVVNASDVPLNNVVVRDQLAPELTFMSATELGQLINGQVVWNVGPLPGRQQKVVQVTARCSRIAPRVTNIAVATADPGLQEQSEANIEIRGVPAYSLEISKIGDPVAVGGKVTYRINVTNTGSLPGNQVEITAILPRELQVAGTDGPTRARIDGNRVIFPALDALQPKQTASYAIDAMALRPGDVRFRVELRAASLSEPVAKEESTNVYGPLNGAVPPPGAQPNPRPPGQ